MLQIITGKFFTTDQLYVTHHRGVLYTNYHPLWQRKTETAIGVLLPTIRQGNISTWVYEVDERLEAVRPDGQKEFMISTGGDEIIQDFSAVVAFALNIT